MKRQMVSGLIALAFIAVATSMLRSHSSPANGTVGAAGMLPLQELQSAVRPNDLAVDDFEDRSLVFPRQTNQ